MSARSGAGPHVVVDMTPLEPGGQNGGAGLVATALVRHLSALALEWRFTLLTADVSHVELACLDAANVQRLCVVRRGDAFARLRLALGRLPPSQVAMRLKRAYRALRTRNAYARTATQLAPDVLFCPFTVPYYWQQGTPCVSIAYDLQHVTYPEFFTVEQRLNRRRHIADAVAASQRIACISEYVRQTLIASTGVSPERAIAIRLAVLHAAAPPDRGVLARLGLTQGQFVLYPANFWPHKNHARLFEAVEMYRRAHAESPLRVVCTGAPNALMRTLARDTPPELALFAGYVDAAELAALYDAAAALIFPSLYEGFGMPVLEALSKGTPVLCSNVTSLPEVAGDAAVYFDPKSPRQMVDALETLADGARMAELVRLGRDQAARAGDARGMAKRYLDLLSLVLS